MSWYQLHLLGIDKAELEQLECLLEDNGALSVTLSDNQDEPIFEPELNTTPYWSDTCVTVLFDDEGVRSQCLEQVQEKFKALQVKLSTLEDKVWEREWLKDFKPMCFGKRLWVSPSGQGPEDSAAVNVVLDPGLAFGTGTHATTALCLAFLDGQALSGKTVCDYGTGSGILAIAALKLGAAHAYGLDIDPQSIIAAKENARRNALDENTFTIVLAEGLQVPKVDLVMANILAQPLVDLSESISGLVSEGGQLILSGILAAQLDEVLEAYQKHLQIIEVQSKDGWQLVVAKKPLRPRLLAS